MTADDLISLHNDFGCVKHVAKMTSDAWQSRQNDVGCVKKLLKSHQMREQVTKIMSDMRKISLKCHRIREKVTQLVSRETTANLGREHPWGMSPMRPHKTPQYFGNETNVLLSREHPWATNAKRRERRHNKRSIHGPWPRGGGRPLYGIRPYTIWLFCYTLAFFATPICFECVSGPLCSNYSYFSASVYFISCLFGYFLTQS